MAMVKWRVPQGFWFLGYLRSLVYMNGSEWVSYGVGSAKGPDFRIGMGVDMGMGMGKRWKTLADLRYTTSPNCDKK